MNLHHILPVASRVAAATLGGYAFTWGLVALGITGLVALGLDFHEAETAVLMLALVAFLVMFLWAFAVRSTLRLWLTLGGGAAAMLLAAWVLQRSLLS